jgi:type II secretion system protein C
MSFASHYFNVLRVLRWPAIAVVVVLGAAFGFMYSQLPECPESSSLGHTALPSWPNSLSEEPFDWSLFRGMGESVPLGEPDFAKNFRFAGTFFLRTDTKDEVRKAVLGVVSEDRQVIASEGDEVAGATVLRIFPDHVILKQGAEEAELWLSFGARESSDGGSDTAGSSSSSSVSKSRFGEQLAADRWMLNRESLMDYYNELLDSPERLLQVFDSLKPIYDSNDKITGYRVGIEGEQDFFDAVGVRENDVVRKVNSLDMTNRNRAEFFIRQFAQDKLSAIVIDVEREGEPRRLVYQVR